MASQTNDDNAEHLINSHGRAANDHDLLLVWKGLIE